MLSAHTQESSVKQFFTKRVSSGMSNSDVDTQDHLNKFGTSFDTHGGASRPGTPPSESELDHEKEENEENLNSPDSALKSLCQFDVWIYF